MTDPRTRRTRRGRDLTDEDLDAIATEVEKTGYDIEVPKTRRRGLPLMGSGPADVVRPPTRYRTNPTTQQ